MRPSRLVLNKAASDEVGRLRKHYARRRVTKLYDSGAALALSGGTGSGLGCPFSEPASVCFGKEPKPSFMLRDNPQVETASVEPYNTV